MRNSNSKTISQIPGLKASRDALMSLKSELKRDHNVVYRLLKDARILTKSGQVSTKYSSGK